MEIVFGLLLLGFLVLAFLARPPLYPTDEEIRNERKRTP